MPPASSPDMVELVEMVLTMLIDAKNGSYSRGGQLGLKLTLLYHGVDESLKNINKLE